MDSLAPYSRQWNSLFEQQSFHNPFLRLTWYECWFDSGLHKSDCRVSTVDYNGCLVAALPLRIETRKLGFLTIKTIQPFFGRLADYNDALVKLGHEMAVMAVLWDLRKNPGWELIQWQDVKPGSSIERCFNLALENGWHCIKYKGIECLSVAVGNSYQDYLSTLSSSRRKRIRQLSRRVETLLSAIEINEEEFCSSSGWLDQCAEIEQSGWKGKNGTGIFCDDTTGIFFKCLFTNLATEDHLHFHGMAIKDRLIAFTLGFKEKGVCFNYTTSYLEQYAVDSIGMYNHYTLIKKCSNLPSIHLIDGMRGFEQYKKNYANIVTNNIDFFFFKNSWLKAVFHIAYSAKKSALKVFAILKRRLSFRVTLENIHTTEKE